jgi:hypothetical protein
MSCYFGRLLVQFFFFEALAFRPYRLNNKQIRLYRVQIYKKRSGIAIVICLTFGPGRRPAVYPPVR